MHGEIGTWANHAVHEEWEAWLEHRPDARSRALFGNRVGAYGPVNARYPLIMMCISGALGYEAAHGSGAARILASEAGWIVPAARTSSDAYEMREVSSIVTPSIILRYLSEECPKTPLEEAMVDAATDMWGGVRRPSRGSRLTRINGEMHAAALETLKEFQERFSPMSHMETSCFLRSDTVRRTFIRAWSQSAEFLDAASKEFLWEAALIDLNENPEHRAMVGHFTVDGEVMRPLVAAAYSDNPYVARWRELSN